MSYRVFPQGLGKHVGGLSGLGGIADLITKGAGLAANTLSNPYVPEVLCRLDQVQAANANPPRVAPGCANTPLVTADTLGIRKYMIPIRAYAYAEQHPWAYLLGAGLVVGVPLLIGYAIGKRKSSP